MTDHTVDAGLVWLRPKRARRDAAPQLSRDRIVAAGLKIADAEGSAALSMRRVAAELGAGVMSLYRHVASKDDLLDLMLDQVLGEVPLHPAPRRTWRATLGELARQDRRMFLRHPWALTLAASRPPLGPNALAMAEYALGALKGLGLDIPTMSRMFSTVHVYVVGFVQSELSEQETRRRTGLTVDQWRAAVAPYIREVIQSGRYPLWSRLITDGNDSKPDEQFEFGLDRMLDGLETYVASAAA
jgi:AcrR family transcriptional regulator